MTPTWSRFLTIPPLNATVANNKKLLIAQALEPGNIDLTKRPKVQNPGGSYSTVRSIGTEVDGGRYVNIPTVINGQVVSNEDAVKHFKKTRQHLGIYKSQAEADAAARLLHEQQADYYGR